MNFKFLPYLLLLLLVLFANSCKTVTLKTANENFDKGNYDAAFTMYQKVVMNIPYTNPKLKSEVYLKMAIAAQNLQRLQPTELALNSAVRLKSQDPQLRLQLAKLYHRQAKYSEAIKQYKLYLAKDSTNTIALNGIKGCLLADSLKKQPTRYQVRSEAKLNSKASDYSPTLFGKEFDQVYFTSTRPESLGKKSDITGQKNSDIYVSKKNNLGQWDAPKRLEGNFNTENDEGSTCFNVENNTIFVTKCRPEKESAAPAEIFVAKRNEALWGELSKVNLFKDSTLLAAHAAISPKGDYLYFVSEGKNCIGGKDIFRGKLAGTKVTEIENLGKEINTAGDEMFPYIRENGELYFASNGLPGLGGLDIFRAVEQTDGTWKVENLGTPINSNFDDFGISFAGLDEAGFLSSNRGDAKGFDHIYAFELPSIKLFLEGSVKSTSNEVLADAQIRVVNDNGLNTKTAVKKDGSFKFKAEKGHKYLLLATCKGYLNNTQSINVANVEKDATYTANFSLLPISRPIAINNIFFDLGKSTLKPESTTSLNQLIGILKQNPNITIELSAHTDANGTVEYNQKLSDERAKVVTTFLVAGGIEADRLTPKGYGKLSPKVVSAAMEEQYPFLKEGDELNEDNISKLNPQQQEIAHQINRRIEFRILKTTYNLF